MALVSDAAWTEDHLAGTVHGLPRDLLMWVLSGILRPLVGFRIVDVDRVPMHGPLLVVANHLSNADPPLLSIAFPRPLFFMGKSELFRIPLLGGFLRRFGGFPVERGTPDRAALRHALDVLNQGHAVAIFPEGGRSRACSMIPGLPGVGLVALQSGAPVLPVAITGTEFFPVNGDWPPRRPRNVPRGVTIRYGDPFLVPERVDGKRVTSQEATQLIMVRVAELLPERYRGVYSSETAPPRSVSL